MKGRTNYREGTWFEIPLPSGIAVGLIARMAPDGRVLGGFFFGPFASAPALESLAALQPSDAILATRFGDPKLVDGSWPILGVLPTWKRESWRLPAFGRLTELTGKAWRVTYPEDDPSGVPKEVQISPAEAKRLPRDGSLGSTAVERVLSHATENLSVKD